MSDKCPNYIGWTLNILILIKIKDYSHVVLNYFFIHTDIHSQCFIWFPIMNNLIDLSHLVQSNWKFLQLHCSHVIFNQISITRTKVIPNESIKIVFHILILPCQWFQSLFSWNSYKDTSTLSIYMNLDLLGVGENISVIQ